LITRCAQQCNNGDCLLGSDGFGLCACSAKFTGPFCNISVVAANNAPVLPPLFPTVWRDTKYGDEHPLFNMTAVATVRLVMRESDFLYMIDPRNEHNESKVPVSIILHNEVVSLDISGKISLKGASTRTCMKLSFKLHADIVDQKVISLKAACEDLTMMRNVLAMDQARAMGQTFQRSGLSQLWINTRFMGFFLIEEEIERQWVEARFGRQTTGLLKVHRGQLFPESNFSNNYEVKQGSSSACYSLLGALATALQSLDVASVSRLFGASDFFRFMPLEFFSGNPDSYSWRGNNWWLLFDENERGLFVPYDQEESFGLGMDVSLNDWETFSSSVFFNCSSIVPPVDCGKHNALSQMLLQTVLFLFLISVLFLSTFVVCKESD
jgi:hypothetical protein